MSPRAAGLAVRPAGVAARAGRMEPECRDLELLDEASRWRRADDRLALMADDTTRMVLE